MSLKDITFNHFKIHTQYSICEGAVKIEELAKFAKLSKFLSLGISDSYNLSGALEFSEEISKAGVHPIIGTQFDASTSTITFKLSNLIIGWQYGIPLLKKGGTIVEGTAGNTGIGIALIAKELGIKTIIVIPDTQSKEKKDTLRQLGAELIEVPAVPYDNPNNYVKHAKKVADDIGGYWGNQFDNTINQLAHIETTAEEIWTQTNGEIDGFVCASGTGGTISGALRSNNLLKRLFLLITLRYKSLRSDVANLPPSRGTNGLNSGGSTGRISKIIHSGLIPDFWNASSTFKRLAIFLIFNITIIIYAIISKKFLLNHMKMLLPRLVFWS